MSNSSAITSKRVSKRRKVSKACVNCRRRKIKCTGTQPCSNCLAYKCHCEYVGRPKQSPEPILDNNNPIPNSNDPSKDNDSPSDRVASVPKPSVPSLLTNNSENGMQYNTLSEIVPKEQQPNPAYNIGTAITPIVATTNTITTAGSSSVNTNTNTDSRDSALRSSLGSPLFTQPSQQQTNENITRETSESSLADENIDSSLFMKKKRKYKKHPKPLDINEPLFKDNGLYDGALEEQDEYKSLVTAINQLESISKPNEVMKDIIKETRGKLNDLIRNWKPIINFKKLKNFKDSKSIETKLMTNKYRNMIYLGRFASLNTIENSPCKNKSLPPADSTNSQPDEKYTPNTSKPIPSFSSQQSFLAQLPLVDELFGLYSPVDALSLRGVGSLVQKYATVKNVDAQAKMKATVYILLRFFDMCCLHLNEGVVSIANPLENYIERKEGVSIESFANRSNKDLVMMIINKFPQPFTEEVTNVSNQDLLKLTDQNLDMFRTLLKMYESHRIGLEQMAMNLTHKNYHPTPESMKQNLDPIVKYFELQDLLLTLCYTYYNATLYHLDEYNSLDYLELLLIFLDHQLWIDQDFGYEKVLVVALDCANKSGLNRWEYYVNIDETLAERRRVAWWRLYEHEKMFSIKRGFLSGINDDKVNCLLPEPMRRVGFVDHADFLNRILTHEYDPKIFEDMSIEDLKFYGRCGLAQILSDLYINVMFNEKYTSIKNVALPQSVREEYLDEIYEYCELTKLRMARIKEQIPRLFKYSDTSKPDENLVPDDERFEANEFVIWYTLYRAFNLKSCSTLSCRLMNQPKTERTKNKLLQYHEEIHLIFVENTRLLLGMETSYEMWRTFQLYCFTFMTACFNTNDRYSFIDDDDIVNSLKLFSHVLILSQTFDSVFNEENNIRESQSIKEFGRSFSMTTILIRILIINYMVKNNITSIELKELLKKKLISMNESIDLVQLVDIFLDHKSYAFNFVLSPVQESGFHLNVQQIMESTYGHNTATSFTASANNITTGCYKSQATLLRNSINDNSTIPQGNGEGKTQSPGVYPAFVLHDSDGNKVSIRNSSSSLASMQHCKSRDGHSPSSLSSTSTTSSSAITMNVPLHNGRSNAAAPAVMNGNGNVPAPPTVNNHLLSQDTNDNTRNNGVMMAPQPNDAYMNGVENPHSNNNNNNNNNKVKMPFPPPLLVQSPMPIIMEDTIHGNNAAPPVINNTAYNFGTLEEFVNNTDLNDLYNSLWNDKPVDMM